MALLAGGDVGLWKRLRIARHLKECKECRELVSAYQGCRTRARESAEELPAGLDWKNLAGDMTGNIRVGLEAGECIEPFVRPVRHRLLTWNLTTALGAVSLLALCGFWLNLPKAQVDHLRTTLTSIVRGVSQAKLASVDGTVLEASPTGPAVQENGSSMKLLVPQSSEAVSVSVSLQDSVCTRYVDADSGQVTINKVYYAQ